MKLVSRIKAKAKDSLSRMLWQAFTQPWSEGRTIDLLNMVWLISAYGSAQYFLAKMVGARNCFNRDALIDWSLSQVKIDGIYCEFGVWKGSSLRTIAKRSKDVYGFDTFEGTDERWVLDSNMKSFDLKGHLPDMPSHVKLITGYFQDTLAPFCQTELRDAAYVHIDSDTYSAAKAVFDHFGDRIVSGTIILFDEYFNFPEWEKHEFQAFKEFVEATGKTYEYIGFASAHQSVAVRIL